MDAGGETSFAFLVDEQGNGTPVDWDMKIFGPHDRLLDAVLPHEITHTIFATHFGRPLPRWADEGACTTVEHVSERDKNHQMLIRFLTAKPSRGIPFNRMFTLKNYPHDILPLYAQGYSLAKFLIFQTGSTPSRSREGRAKARGGFTSPLSGPDRPTLPRESICFKPAIFEKNLPLREISMVDSPVIAKASSKLSETAPARADAQATNVWRVPCGGRTLLRGSRSHRWLQPDRYAECRFLSWQKAT
jgi:hypothetical protein